MTHARVDDLGDDAVACCPASAADRNDEFINDLVTPCTCMDSTLLLEPDLEALGPPHIPGLAGRSALGATVRAAARPARKLARGGHFIGKYAANLPSWYESRKPFRASGSDEGSNPSPSA